MGNETVAIAKTANKVTASGDPSRIHVALLITFIGIGRFSFFSSALERAGGVDRTFARNRFALIV